MLIRSILALVLIGLVAPAASADLITFTETVTGAGGTLNGNTYSNATVTISTIADSSNVIQPGVSGIYALPGTITVTVDQSGVITTGTLLNYGETGVFVSLQGQDLSGGASGYGPTAGFYDYNSGSTSSALVMSTPNADFAIYFLGGSIGPENGNAIFNNDVHFATTLGSGKYFSIGGGLSASTFTATVPEPSSLLMGLTASVLGLGYQRIRATRVRRTAR